MPQQAKGRPEGHACAEHLEADLQGSTILYDDMGITT